MLPGHIVGREEHIHTPEGLTLGLHSASLLVLFSYSIASVGSTAVEVA